MFDGVPPESDGLVTNNWISDEPIAHAVNEKLSRRAPLR